MSNHKIILSGGIAKRLLTRGHYICDLKPKRENIESSCFIFFEDKWLQEDIHSIMNDKTTPDRAVLQKRLQALDLTEMQYRQSIIESYLEVGREQ